MARSSAERLSHIASCADYNSDDGEVLTSRKQANISVKRSGDLARENEDTLSALTSPASKITTDLQSDSGYSSHTHLTNVSADTELSVKSPAVASTVAGTVAATVASTPVMSDTALHRTPSTRERRSRPSGTDNTKKGRRQSQNRAGASPERPSLRATASSSARRASPKRPSRTPRPAADEHVEARPHMHARAATAPAQRPPPAGYAPHMHSHPQPMPSYADPRYRMPPMMRHDPYMPPPYMRPPMPHHASEMYARPYPPHAPTLHQHPNARPAPFISARRAASPYRSDGEDEYDLASQRFLEQRRAQDRRRQEHEARERREEEFRRREAEEIRRRDDEREALLIAAAIEHRRQEALRREMPPPLRPSSAMPSGQFSRPPPRSPILPSGYDDLFLARSQYPSSSIRAPSPHERFDEPRAKTPARRNSVLDSDVYLDEIENQRRALARRELDLENKQKALKRQEQSLRQRQRAAAELDEDAELRPRMRRMSLGRDEYAREQATAEAAEKYISKTSSSSTLLTAGILKNADRHTAASERSRKSLRSERTAEQSKRRSLLDHGSDYQGGFKTRINVDHDHEFEIGGTRVGLYRAKEGQMEVFVEGAHEKQYHSSKASSSNTSKLGRRLSRRHKEESADDVDATEREHRARYGPSSSTGTTRRRAETISGALSSRQGTTPSLRRTNARVRSPSPIVAQDDTDDDNVESWSSEDELPRRSMSHGKRRLR